MTLLSCFVATALTIVGQPSGYPATRAAVVDVGTVSERYLKTSTLEAQFERRRVRLNEERKALEDKIERASRSLREELKPGTREFSERRKQLALLEAERQWFLESEGQRIEQELARSLREIYNDIRDVVREVAEERRIEVVLSVAELPEEPPTTTAQARQQIVLQKVLYWHPTMDLTDEVVARLNSRLRAANSGPGGGSARPSPGAGREQPWPGRSPQAQPPNDP